MADVHFKTNILLKNIIGKDLITDDNLAVLELVKNSFDAGSPEVSIIYNNIIDNDDNVQIKLPTSQTSQLIIKDEGAGMNEDDLINKWLNIAYSEKKEIRENYGRIQAGNKGVGRFSCDRLGHFLTIYSRKRGSNFFKLFIDWRLFEREGQQDSLIQDIKLNISELTADEFSLQTGYDSFESGTILEIAYLREFWTKDKILSLKRELEKFINPNQIFSSSRFEIFLYAKDYQQDDNLTNDDIKKINGRVENKIFDKLNFKSSSITSSIDECGEYITTILQDRGNDIFILKEKNTFSQLSNVKVTVYYLNPYAKRYFTNQTGIRSVDFGSIFLFIDGFRVPPYGDDGDDWLGLEIRKGQGYNRYLGTREIVGRIEVNNNHDNFIIISNRSGVVNNVAFEQLTHSTAPYGFFYKTFRRLERFVVEGISWDKIGNIQSKFGEKGEKYKLDDLTRSKQILSVIKNIIDANDTQISSLIINEEFVSQIIDSQIERAKTDLNDMLQDIAQKASTMDPLIIEKYQQELGENTEELRHLMALINNITPTSDRIKDVNHVQSLIDEKQTEFSELKKSLEAEIKARKHAEEEKLRIEKELELEKEKNTYLRTSARNLSDDAKGLIHNIKIVSKKISSSVENLYDKIHSNSMTQKDILKALGVIRFQSEKVLKISKIITRANFRTDKTDQIVDVVGYIEQYVSIYRDIYEDTDLHFSVNKNNSSLMRKVSVLEIALVLDDLISNSEKAGAKFFQLDMTNIDDNSLRVIVSDDGKGIDEKFMDNPEKIFELGVTTTNGSGIGLNSVRTALKSMKASISFLGNGKKLSGAAFEILFK